jgi:DNA-binding CsgD family transcriptional regulator
MNMNDDIFDATNYLAISVLEHIGIDEPSQKVIDVMELALSHVVLNQQLLFDARLTKKECACLYWAAKGKTTQGTAKILNTTFTAIEACRRNIKRKLRATSMAHAVFEGIRFGYIQNVGCNHLSDNQ